MSEKELITEFLLAAEQGDADGFVPVNRRADLFVGQKWPQPRQHDVEQDAECDQPVEKDCYAGVTLDAHMPLPVMLLLVAAGNYT